MPVQKNVQGMVPKPFEEAITLTSFGKFNLFALIAIGGSLMSVINETLAAMFITPAAQCDLSLSLTEKGILYSAGFLGVVASSHFWGFVADTKGRKIVLLTSLIVSAAITFVESLITTTWLFILLRFFNGFFIGGSSAVSYAYIGEFHNIRYRPKVVSWAACFIAFGNIYLPGMAWLLLPQKWSHEIPALGTVFKPWRLLMIIYALPSVITAILIFFLPESPRYLLNQGKDFEVLKILKNIFAINTGKKRSEFPVSTILDGGNASKEGNKPNVLKSMWEQTKPLFQKYYIIKTFLLCYLQFTSFIGSSAILMWYPQILNMMSEYEKVVPSSDVTMCKSIDYDQSKTNKSSTNGCVDTVHGEVFLINLLIGVCYLIIYIFMGSIINLTGPKAFAVGLISLTTISGIVGQLVSGYIYIQLTLGFFLMGAVTITAINAIVVELYPTNIRGMALSIAAMFARLGAMTGSNFIGPLMYKYCDYMFFIFAAIHLTFIIGVLLVPSQKTTKS